MNKKILSAYIELAKPRILSLVLVTTFIGYYLGSKGAVSILDLIYLLLGVSLTCGGSGALNHYLERDVDGLMARTKNRPIPTGVISPNAAFLYGVMLVLAGVIVLYIQLNVLTAFLSLLTSFLYVLVYTPLKRVSWLNTSVGAIPGALPPMGGWAAATGDIGVGAWVLFLILFLWQHPHFYAIAWMFKNEYRDAGFKMLPNVKSEGEATFHHIIGFIVMLLPISLMPSFIGMSGAIYFYGVFLLGVFLMIAGERLASTKSVIDARKLLQATVVYLPALLFLIIIDTSF